MAFNLSPDTLLRSREEAKKLGVPDEFVHETPCGNLFNQQTQGILPTILGDLLAARKRAKKQLKEATDPLEKSVFDGKQ